MCHHTTLVALNHNFHKLAQQSIKVAGIFRTELHDLTIFVTITGYIKTLKILKQQQKQHQLKQRHNVNNSEKDLNNYGHVSRRPVWVGE